MIVIIGLGNPEKKFTETRHNVGFQCIDYLHHAWQFVAWDEKKKFKSLIAKGTVDGVSVMLVKPQTYMNRSGEAVETLASYYDIPPENIWIIHDELDLPFSTFKVQHDRGSASHNGIESVMQSLGTKAFYRWRIGISPQEDRRPKNSHGFVLKKFSFFERRKRTKLFEKIKASLEEHINKRT